MVKWVISKKNNSDNNDYLPYNKGSISKLEISIPKKRYTYQKITSKSISDEFRGRLRNKIKEQNLCKLQPIYWIVKSL